MEHVLIFVADLRNKALRKGINLPDLFLEYDRGQTGTITIENFRKLMANVNCYVDEDKFQFIITPYTEKNIFYYDLFLHDMQDARVKKDSGAVTQEELREFGSHLRDQGTDVIDCVRMFDKNRTGRVSVPIFLRNTSNTLLAQKIAKEYANEATGEVEYFRLSADIKNALNSAPREAPRTPVNQLPSCMSDVAKHIRAQGIDIVQVMSRHDRYKRNRIQAQQFLSEFANWGIPISPSQMNEVAAAFDSGGGMIDYVTFADEISRIIRTTPRPTSARRPVVDLNELLNRTKEFIINRKPRIVEAVESFDPRHTGRIPAQRFFRSFMSSGLQFSNEECGVIEHEFGDLNGNIDYDRFFQQVIPKQAPQVDIQLLLGRLHDFLLDNGLQLRNRLSRFDDGTGHVTFTQLNAAFRAIGFDINQLEASVLKGAFGRGAEWTISIDDICSACDPKLPPKPEPEKLPPLPRHDRDEEATKALDAMTRVAIISEKYALNLREEFRKFDTKLNGLILSDSFRLVLDSLPIKLLPAEVECLAGFYTSSGGYCSYDQFCSDMEDFGSRRAHQMPSLSKTLLADSKPQVNAVDPVLHKLKIFLMKDRISPETVFAPYDNTQTGLIPRVRLMPILESIGFPCTESDVVILADAFMDPRVTEKINYKRLCAVLNQLAIQQEEFETTSVALDNNSGVPDEATMLVMSQLLSKMQTRRKKPRMPFQGFRSNLIPQNEFRRCVESYGFSIPEPDMQKIMKAYRRNLRGDIDWNRFCTDMETNFAGY